MGVLIGMIVFRSDHGKSLAISDDWSSTGRSLSQHTKHTHSRHSQQQGSVYKDSPTSSIYLVQHLYRPIVKIKYTGLDTVLACLYIC